MRFRQRKLVFRHGGRLIAAALIVASLGVTPGLLAVPHFGRLGAPAVTSRSTRSDDGQPWYDSRDFDALVEELGLDEDRRVRLRELLHAYRTACFEAASEHREHAGAREAAASLERQLAALERGLADARASGVPEAALMTLVARREALEADLARAVELGGGPVERTRADAARAARARSARHRFEQAVALLLESDADDPDDPGASAAWHAWRSTVHRTRGARDAALSWERIDLLAVAASVDVPVPEDLAGAYAADMDAALEARDAVLPELRIELARGRVAASPDGMRTTAARMHDARADVATTNAAYLDRLVAHLSAEDAERIRAACMRVAHPRVFGPSSVDQLILALGGMELSADERSSLDRIGAEYAALRKGLDRGWALAIEASARHAFIGRLVHEAGGPAPGGKPVPERASARDRRWALDRDHADRLRQALPARVEALPEALRSEPGSLGEQAWALERFDRDGDGRLDAAEREHLRQWLARERR